MERTSVRFERQVDAVPMHGRRLAQLVLEMDDDVIALAHVESRTRYVPVIGEHFTDDARLQFESGDRCGEIYLDGLRQRRDVDEQRGIQSERARIRFDCGRAECLWWAGGCHESQRQYADRQ